MFDVFKNNLSLFNTWIIRSVKQGFCLTINFMKIVVILIYSIQKSIELL